MGSFVSGGAESERGFECLLKILKAPYIKKGKVFEFPGKNFKVVPTDGNSCVADVLFFGKLSGIGSTLKKNKVAPRLILPGIASAGDGKKVLLKDGANTPLISESKEISFGFDPGLAFYNLITEAYFSPMKSGTGLLRPLLAKAPYAARASAARTYYKRRHSSLAKVSTQFPCEPTGYVLLEIVKRIIDTASISYWPAGHEFAIALSSDIDLSKYAASRGIVHLLQKIEGTKLKPTIFVTANVVHYLPKINVEVGSHGLQHYGKIGELEKPAFMRRVSDAKEMISRRFEVSGFRSPDLARISHPEIIGRYHEYDSSTIDLDRENPSWCGAGVGLNLPFFRESLVEIPVTGPMDSFFLYTGNNALPTYREKMDWIVATGGLYNALCHPGTWGEADRKRREKILSQFISVLPESGWYASLSEVADWWKKRDEIGMVLKGNKLVLSSKDRLDIVLEYKGKKTKLSLDGKLSLTLLADKIKKANRTQ